MNKPAPTVRPAQLIKSQQEEIERLSRENAALKRDVALLKEVRVYVDEAPTALPSAREYKIKKTCWEYPPMASIGQIIADALEKICPEERIQP